MTLRIVTPTGVHLDVPATRLVAEAPNGAFGILPRHVDFVSELTAGILVYETPEGAERFVGLNTGTLVKCDHEVTIATRAAIDGETLGELKERVESTFLQLDEHERVARSALARLEAGVIRSFIDLEKPPE